MDKVKAGKQLREVIRLCVQADQPVLLCGPHGVGKSEIVAQAAAELGIGFICRDLSLLEPPDLIGLPKIHGRTTTYLPPDFLPKDGNGLLVFEELNRCERYMRAPCLQLMTARTLNDYHLPPGWLPVAAINPSEGDYEVSELDPALLSRFACVQVVPDRTEWLDWARSHAVHPAVISYVESDDSIFDHADSNPRAWTYVGRVLAAAEEHSAPPVAIRTAVLGLVGAKRGSAFLRTLSQAEKPLTADEILDSYRKRRRSMQGWVKGGRVDLVETSLRAIELHLQPKAAYRQAKADPDAWNNLAQFLADLPGDLRDSAKSYFSERNYQYPQPAKKGARR